MNPPSAIHGAMGQERKPFTYTPGGLDLSEIKSERMAKRLMRNAMNQGVPEVPVQSIQSPPTPSTPIAVPNFNCLPVQVFPTFALPANPKSLLRTRSTPDPQKDPPPQKALPSTQIVTNLKPSGMEQLRETMNNNTKCSQVNNNYRPQSMCDYGSLLRSTNNLTKATYRNDAHEVPILPEICYDAEYLRVAPKNNTNTENKFIIEPISYESNNKMIPSVESRENIISNFTVEPISVTNAISVTKPEEINMGSDDDDQKEVKIVKKQVKKEKKLENGDQNGEAEAEMTVKLPSKKSAAKTETKVEVVQKQLPDGSMEEIKTTTTKTTIDGKTEIKTKTETTIIPKAEEEEEEIEEEEEEEEEEENTEIEVKEVEENDNKEIIEEPAEIVVTKTVQEVPAVKESSSKIVQSEEKSETTTTTTKKVVVQESIKEPESEPEEQENEVEEAETVVIRKPPAQKPQPPPKQESEEAEDEEEEREEKVEEVVKSVKPTVVKQEQEEEEEEEEEDEEEDAAAEPEVQESVKEEPAQKESQQENPNEEDVEEEETEIINKKSVSNVEKSAEPPKKTDDDESEYTEEEIESEKEEAPKSSPVSKSEAAPQEETVNIEVKKEEQQVQKEPEPQPEAKVPLREPSIPLEKVEEVEIKPIGQGSVSRTHTESTEIITSSSDKPAGIQSTQTEYNRIENIVTVNRTTKTLDHSYEQLTQQGIPTVKTYFAPERERVSTSPQPSRPYQPVYPPAQQPERRHSLLLERLSTERQMPSDIYQNNYQLNNQNYGQQQQWSQEPQSEVINVSNVKPSTITNSQWFQQQSRKENVLYNNILPTTMPPAPSQQWSQPQPQPQPQYQTSHIENTSQETSRISSNNYQQSAYPSFTLQPSNWSTNNAAALPTTNTQPSQYSLLNQDTSETYKNTTQYSSSYVPPPWEQDPRYVAPELPAQNLYQVPSVTSTFSTDSKPGWKPTPPTSKFSKPVPTSYVPPAPNQSFVKSVTNVVEQPKLPGRKTYYSEYERRYITVPESTYIPSETKFQPQPDPSPQYYYDNNEPSEAVEPQWRRELREFTEKTTQCQPQQPTELTTSVKPPWEEDAKYAKVPSVTYTPTPSWSQTLRPQTWRERSFESEYVGSKEWSKTNTLGRGRPLSSYGNVEPTIPERPRGVSVDRYNPNNYKAPGTTEYAPVQTHTHNPAPSPQAQGYHNPNVPAYHARASAELREQAPIPQSRPWGLDTRATPIQSRSFKYLQWITGTED